MRKVPQPKEIKKKKKVLPSLLSAININVDHILESWQNQLDGKEVKQHSSGAESS